MLSPCHRGLSGAVFPRPIRRQWHRGEQPAAFWRTTSAPAAAWWSATAC